MSLGVASARSSHSWRNFLPPFTVQCCAGAAVRNEKMKYGITYALLVHCSRKLPRRSTTLKCPHAVRKYCTVVGYSIFVRKKAKRLRSRRRYQGRYHRIGTCLTFRSDLAEDRRLSSFQKFQRIWFRSSKPSCDGARPLVCSPYMSSFFSSMPRFAHSFENFISSYDRMGNAGFRRADPRVSCHPQNVEGQDTIGLALNRFRCRLADYPHLPPPEYMSSLSSPSARFLFFLILACLPVLAFLAALMQDTT
ncbi:hypothetical protein EDB89DRAFT_955641 [Lactarius sanguifluus]|nr:hypothetical protein EDB89DRAFT_955641 [Lactarius sanguifluus]